MLVIAAPGQGAQPPGSLPPRLELPGFAERLGAWSELAGVDLVASGTTASAEEIRDTAVAQPLLVAAAIAAAGGLFGGLDPGPPPPSPCGARRPSPRRSRCSAGSTRPRCTPARPPGTAWASWAPGSWPGFSPRTTRCAWSGSGDRPWPRLRPSRPPG